MNDSKNVTLEHFAIFREVRKKDSETVDTSARTARDLYTELHERFEMPLPIEALRVAINDEFAPWEHEIREGDRIAFIAPVAGG